ncbi:MAG: MBL fold metallo-hydrolase [Pseudobdellovibrionaceae bacterium]
MEKLIIGDYEICPLPTGIFGLDGGAMFGTVPKVLWEKEIPADDKNRIPMEARALLLKGTDRKIVIDTGNGGDFIAKYGEKLGKKFAEMYNINPEGPSLLKSIESYGLKAEDITEVILTHLHFDHAGGATTEKNGKLVPTFPKATYYVQAENLETARKPNIREKASYFPANFEPLVESGQLKILHGPQINLLPGVSVQLSQGHTRGQQIVKISDDKNTMVYCADLIPTSAHVKLAWIMGYDLDPLTLIEEKRQLLEEATAKKWYLFFEHDPKTPYLQL